MDYATFRVKSKGGTFYPVPDLRTVPALPALHALQAGGRRGGVFCLNIDSQSRRCKNDHMAFIDPHKITEIENRLKAYGIRKEDVTEKFIRSSGAGGQNVNKVSTAVYLKHIPTGIQVKMQKERSQSLNRFLAWRLLLDKIESKILGEKSRKQKEIEKARRQKRKRSRRAKEKMLRGKKMQSEKKKSRRISPNEIDRGE
jgi:protein subunit release factor B